MKLAILGSSPIALEAAHRFHQHGAAITLFNFSEAESWPLSEQQQAMLEVIREEQVLKPYRTLAITKRFLAPDEVIAGRSRFHDLFRVIYQVDPTQFIQQQKKSDPALYQKLSAEIEASLQSTLEMFEDFDAIIDLRAPSVPRSMAVTGRALGEGRKYSKVFSGQAAALIAPDFAKDTSVREVALVGSSGHAAVTLLKLDQWLDDERNRLFLITHEEEPFAHFIASGDSNIVASLQTLLNKVEGYHQQAVEEFMVKLREWQELDDFVQVKIPKPVEPIPRINIFSGHNVTAIDELIDRERIFLTLEKPDFREGKQQPENNLVELKTIGVDRVLVANGFRREMITEYLQTGERGYFSHVPADWFLKNNWEADLAALKGIEDEIFKLFTPAGAH